MVLLWLLKIIVYGIALYGFVIEYKPFLFNNIKNLITEIPQNSTILRYNFSLWPVQ